MKLRAHAKVNTVLFVGARRADGYHTLETIFQEISLHDVLTFRSQPSALTLKVNKKGLPTGKDNLVMRALLALKKELKPSAGLEVVLEKYIPMGAGLGGGSSDAAAALWGGWLLWKKRPLSAYRKGAVPPVLTKCAKRLGADVAFFLKGGRAHGTGVGEKLKTLLSLEKEWMVLAYPRVGVSTRDAYRWLDQHRAKGGRGSNPEEKFDLNSFERVVFPRVPPVRRAFESLLLTGCRRVMMSGSGSTVFGFVASAQEGRRVIKKLSRIPLDLTLAHTI